MGWVGGQGCLFQQGLYETGITWDGGEDFQLHQGLAGFQRLHGEGGGGGGLLGQCEMGVLSCA